MEWSGAESEGHRPGRLNRVGARAVCRRGVRLGDATEYECHLACRPTTFCNEAQVDPTESIGRWKGESLRLPRPCRAASVAKEGAVEETWRSRAPTR